METKTKNTAVEANDVKELTLISQESLQRFNDIQQKITEYQNLDLNMMSQMAVAAAKANVVQELQKALPKQMVQTIKDNLENNRLGFKTDKDEGYPIEKVRTALIEAAIHGFHWHGNEFNIIGGNAYFTKEGFTNKIKRTEDFTDMKIFFGIPKYDIENKRAIIHIEATWLYKKKPMELKRDFSIKLTIDKYGKNWTTDDAIEGKAERKIKAKIYEISTGAYLPDADSDEINAELKFKNAEMTEAQVEDEISKNANKEPLDIEPEPAQVDWESPISIIAAVELIEDADELKAFHKNNAKRLTAFGAKDQSIIEKAINDQLEKLLVVDERGF